MPNCAAPGGPTRRGVRIWKPLRLKPERLPQAVYAAKYVGGVISSSTLVEWSCPGLWHEALRLSTRIGCACVTRLSRVRRANLSAVAVEKRTISDYHMMSPAYAHTH